ncbi:PhnB protein [Nocardioides terrae]|uniref:PhnB protein n=1 Tax=Nocardioides terrae TaxID=574651 RepID=A0A1I1NE01_9ACTN|nr:VOC family protein [Nocardioides terrae]SFC91960.1 PhnB protein [Nocardioides terrae]
MASKLNPYLSFKDTARDAMEFYKSVFGGELFVSTFGDMGDPGAAGADLVMHASLETPSGYTLFASDTPPGMEFTTGAQVTLSLSGDAGSGDELRGYWQQLSADGTVKMPLERQVWGDDFGMVTDRFGIEWMVNIAGEGAG